MPTTISSPARLAAAAAAANERMKPFRRNRLAFLKQYAGPHYAPRQQAGGAGPAGPEPLNLIYSLASVVLPHLVACNPRAMIRTTAPQLADQAEVFSLAWNHLARQIDLARSLRTVVTDALFGAGIMKTGLGPAAAGELGDNGAPFADVVDLDDYIIDPAARCRPAARFEGNRYRVPLEQLMESGLYDRKAAAAIEPLCRDGRDQTRGAAPGAGDSDALGRSVELIDLWLADENVVVTLAADVEEPAGFLRQVQWYGSDRGPYEMLGFHWISGNPLPVPPVALVFDLHVMINKVARKLGRQADRQKELVLFDDRAADEATRVRDANDGEMVGVQSVDRYRQVSFGGPNEDGYRHLGFLFEQFSRIGGNVDLLGGLRPQSDTLGQDEMLYTNATARIEDMRREVYEFTKHVGAKLAWYLWHDPLVEMPLVRRQRDGSEAAVIFSAAQRAGRFMDYHFDIEPYSMSPDSPTRRYRRTLEWIDHVVLPTAQIAAAQGRPLDVERLAAITGKMLNIDQAGELYRPPANAK